MADPSRRVLLSGLLLSSLGGAMAPWPGGARAAVSLTYDDGLNSQIDNVVPQLQARGLKGTFFLVQENVDERIADWVAVANLGHEIGNHTATHKCALAGFSEAAFADEQILPMEAYLDLHFGARRLRSFAYPCGYLGLGRGNMRRRFGRYRQSLEHTFAAARTVAGGPNDPRAVPANRFDLTAFEPTYDADEIAPAIGYLDATLAKGQWAILVFHEVLPQRLGEGDTTLARHAQILDLIGSRSMWCAPMGEVFGHVMGGAAAAPS